VKDVAPRREGRRWFWEHVPLGYGLVPWPEVIAALTHAGYRGWMVLDHRGGKPSTAGLHSDVEALRSLLFSTP
jgi:sugar phosphate isomerase/epimerase